MSGESSPSSQFRDAVSYLSNASSLSKLSTPLRLELYGLFKFITVSQFPTSSRPSILDITGRAKWDAWNHVGASYKNKLDAEHRYLTIARELGWVEDAGRSLELIESSEAKPDHGDENWSSLIQDEMSSQKAGPSAMGVYVSSVVRPTKESDNTIHDFAISDDVESISKILREQSGFNVNEPDEHGYTPLHLATDRGNLETVQLLLKHGADPSIKDPDGLTAAELAKVAGHERLETILGGKA